MGDFVQVQPDSSGKQVQAKAVPTPDGSGVSYRQTVEIGDDQTTRTNTLLRRILEELVKIRMIGEKETSTNFKYDLSFSDEDLGI